MEKKFTILNVIDTFFSNFWKLFKCWKVWLIYAVILFVLGIICGNWSHSCKSDLYASWWCPSASNVYVAYIKTTAYFLATLFLCFSYAYDLYNNAFAKVNFCIKTIFEFSKSKLKFMGFSFGLCFIFFALLAVCVWLIFKKANPDWLIEFGYFLIVFVFATFSILILRTSASLGVFLIHGKMPNFKLLFTNTSGKFYVVLITFCVLTYFVNIILLKSLGFFDILNTEKNIFILALTSEFLSSIFKFMALTAYTAYFLTMAQILEPMQNPINEQKINKNTSTKTTKKIKKKKNIKRK